MRCLEVFIWVRDKKDYRWLTQLRVHWLGYPEVSWEQDNKEERWSENLFLKVIKLTNETMTRPYTPRGMKRMIGRRGCAIFKPQITVAYVGEFGMKTKNKKKD